jgi:predicted transcriptional regulator
MKAGIRKSGVRVRDLMTEAVLFLNMSHSLEEAWQALHENAVTGAPVIGSKGRLVGVVTTADLADPRRNACSTVGDVMTRLVYAVRADDPAMNAVRLMLDEGIHRAIVVNDDATIAGIVAPMDVLRALASGLDVREPSAGSEVQYVDLREG